MSLVATFDVKGWCPGALRPMESGDGLIARVRPWCGAFSLAQASGLAEIAERLGNGHIDLTRRANLQIRGLREEGLPGLHDALDRLGLLDPDPATEAARNIMVGPLAGTEARTLAEALSRALAEDRRVGALPAKFGWLVDGGGPLSIIGERADIALYVTDAGMALRVDGQWLGGGSVESALAAAFGARPALPKIDIAPVPGRRRLGRLAGMTGVAVSVWSPRGGAIARAGRVGSQGGGIGNSSVAVARTLYQRACRDPGGAWSDRRRERSTAANRCLSRSAGLSLGFCRYKAHGAPARGVGLRWHTSCVGLRQGLRAVGAGRSYAGGRGRPLWRGAQRNGARCHRTDDRCR